MESFMQMLTSHGILFPILLVIALIIFVFMIQRFVFFFVWFILFAAVVLGALSLYDPEVGKAVEEVFYPKPKAGTGETPSVMDRLVNLKDKIQNMNTKSETPPPPARGE